MNRAQGKQAARGQVAGALPTSVLPSSSRQTASDAPTSVRDLQAVEAALSVLNIDTPRGAPKRTQAYGDDVRSRVYLLLTQKVPCPQIRDQTNVALGTIQRWKKEWTADPQTDSSCFSTVSNCNRVSVAPIDQLTRERVTARILSREPLQTISDQENIALSTLSRWRNEAGLPAAQPVKGPAWSVDSRGKVLFLLRFNKSVREVSELTGVPVPTIYTWKREREAGAASNSTGS